MAPGNKCSEDVKKIVADVVMLAAEIGAAVIGDIDIIAIAI